MAELLATFRAVGVEREALAGILFLRDAVKCAGRVGVAQLIAISLGKLDGRAAPPLDPKSGELGIPLKQPL